MLVAKGYKLYATGGTASFLEEHGVPAEMLHWPDSDFSPNVIDYLNGQKIDLVINIPKNHSTRELSNGYKIRRTAVDHNIPLITNSRLARAYIYAIFNIGLEGLSINSWEEY